ncbi:MULTISPECIES: Re/Si-specific NAD(P)(+) transhydrogenase subunit alpha [unclassified Nocardioides]|uniref:Re/Si-specific NAD(P)(+) transhydrogenase subunit alpha n=1 Tax=unclassified Nocardioides TaxID=2615069 RepID=UPI0007033934|nr:MULTISPECIES: Re/Si-specific NAD(P)(+) transhydrogenase subunit alpha [unclassified Nocardioides]KRC52990.1 NAD(P) transhydrogenase subunit alpha [Nocardioides sp. Root79]KRC72519.1 NAD(P) transhydrogenase subunit alpha [Nocardioides sp. Root240]
MLIGIPRESKPGETLVAATAKTVSQLTNLGYDVIVESGAGVHADQPDSAFMEAGVRVGTPEEVWAADVVVKVNAPSDEEIGRLRQGATIISMMAPGRSPELLEKLQAQGVTALAMDAVPRISRAQSMDVLSSMANVAGYRAVVESAHEFGRMFTGQVTAAGKIPPARVFVVGAGVAGLAAIGAASAMGAIVRAFDVRPEVAEQVESMGAQFVHVDMEQEVSSDGYAKEMSEAQVAATAAMYDEEARAADIVITTALIPGRPAPSLLTAETVAGMRNGSVIVDMAAANGGNAAGTVADQKVVTDNGVTILGYTDLAGRLAAQTSQLYGTNIVNLLKLLTPEKDGNLGLDFEDVVQRGITVVDGRSESAQITWPPPAVQVSAAPAAAAPAAAAAAEPKAPMSAGTKVGLVLGAIGLFWLVNALAPTDELRRHFTVLMLSIVIGYYVIGKVAHALHTPLMSVTNAISGVVVVGALLQVAAGDDLVLGLSLVAILLASINVFGGFAVTRRMLAMFSKGA